MFLPRVFHYCQSVTVENNKAVSTVTLKATPEVIKDGVTCEVSNDYGKDSKVFQVNPKGQCQEKTWTMIQAFCVQAIPQLAILVVMTFSKCSLL